MSGIDITDMVHAAWERIVIPVIKEIEDGELDCDRDVHRSGDGRCVCSVVLSGSLDGRSSS